MIPTVVRRDVYLLYNNSFWDSPFSKYMLKDQLREMLKELKIGTLNLENSNAMVLQDDDILMRL